MNCSPNRSNPREKSKEAVMRHRNGLSRVFPFPPLFFRNLNAEKFRGTTEIACNGYQLWDVPSKTDLDLHFPGTDFLAERSEGDSRSESSPVRPVRQFWIKSLYPTIKAMSCLTVNRKIKIELKQES